MKQKLNIPSEQPLVCRADKDPLVLSFIFLVVVLILFWATWTSPRPQSWGETWFSVAALGTFGLISAGLAWAVIHRRAVSTSEGLTTFGFFTTRFFSWRDIEDYELRPAKHWQEKPGLPIAMLRVRSRWYPIHSAFMPREALLEHIRREAQWSQASEWQLRELRDKSMWPKTFAYPPDSFWRRVGTYASLFLWITAPPLGILFALHYADIETQWADILPIGHNLIIAGTLALPVYITLIALAHHKTIRIRRRFSGQEIIATIEGLRYLKDGEVQDMAWSEIESYYSEPKAGLFQQSVPCFYFVKSSRLNIEFFTGIRGEEKLKTLIQNRAKNAFTKD